MKQLIAALVLSFSITATVSANSIQINQLPLRADRDTSKFEGGKDELAISPNTKTGSALLTFKADKEGKGTVIVFNEAGKIVLKQPVKLLAGQNKINVHQLTNLEEGNYTVCLNTSHKIYSTPLLLWK